MAGALKPVFHPPRCGSARVYPFDEAAAETATQVRCMYGYWQMVLRDGGDWRKRRQRERRAGESSDFTRDAQYGECIGAIGCELDGEQAVVEIKDAAHASADRGIRRQWQQARMIIRHPQLAARAQHSFAFDSAHLGALDVKLFTLGIWRESRSHQGARHFHARRNVGRTADNIKQLRLTHINLTDVEPVSVRVFFKRFDLCDDDAFKRRGGSDTLFDFEAGHRKSMRQRLARQRWIDEAAQPSFGEFHGSLNCCKKRISPSKNKRKSSIP